MTENPFQLPGYQVIGMQDTGVAFDVHLQPPSPVACSSCGTIGDFVKNGTRDIRVMDLPVHGKPVTLWIARQRFQCKSCGSTFRPELPGIHPDAKMTERLHQYIEREAFNGTHKALAERVGVDEKTVRTIFSQRLVALNQDYKPEMPKMCRRLSLARALVHRPQIVFSDGLPGGEQAVSDAMVLRTLSDYAKETGATVLLCTDHLESAEEICTSFAVLEHGFLRASGDLSMLTAASELTPMAVIRVSDTQKMPEDFILHDGAWEKPIESEADMPELISGLVRENVGIYEASVCTPTLQDVYYAFVKKPGEETPHEEAVL